VSDKAAKEKVDILKAYGAEVLLGTTGVALEHPDHLFNLVRRVVAETPGAWLADQYDNPANPDVHVRTTGPEIWQQTEGTIDGFVSAVGTGGTLAGVAAALRDKRKDMVVAIADVPGAALYSYYTTGELKSEGSSITEGIGQGRITANLEGLQVDEAFFIPDSESLDVAFGLLCDEGLSLGLSSGVNVAGAIRLARKLGPGKTIVTILCDPGSRYQSRLYNPEFLLSKGLTPPEWLVQPRRIEPDFEETQ